MLSANPNILLLSPYIGYQPRFYPGLKKKLSRLQLWKKAFRIKYSKSTSQLPFDCCSSGIFVAVLSPHLRFLSTGAPSANQQQLLFPVRLIWLHCPPSPSMSSHTWGVYFKSLFLNTESLWAQGHTATRLPASAFRLLTLFSTGPSQNSFQIIYMHVLTQVLWNKFGVINRCW